MSNHIEKIKSGATTAFIDSANKSSVAYKPEFISKDIFSRKMKLIHLLSEALT
ncbi:hypothetical protein SAMN04487934_10483 [Eubacterium ruminantium]|nr:hypothetical protein SAMN04487934_10483 [Eubacterium ruminantium]